MLVFVLSLVLLGFTLVLSSSSSLLQPAHEFLLLLPPLCDLSVTLPLFGLSDYAFVIFSVLLHVFAKPSRHLFDFYQVLGVFAKISPCHKVL